MPASIGTPLGSSLFNAWAVANHTQRTITVAAGQGVLVAAHVQFGVACTISDSQSNTGWVQLPAGGVPDGGAANTDLRLFFLPLVSAAGSLTIDISWGSTTAPQGQIDVATVSGHNAAAGAASVALIGSTAGYQFWNGSANVLIGSLTVSGTVPFTDCVLVEALGINSNNADRHPLTPADFARISTGWDSSDSAQLDWSKKTSSGGGTVSVQHSFDASGHSGASMILIAIQSAPTATTLRIPLSADWIGVTGLKVDWWPPAGPTASTATRITSGLSCVSDGAGGGKIDIASPAGLSVGDVPTALVQGTPPSGNLAGLLCGTASYVNCSVV